MNSDPSAIPIHAVAGSRAGAAEAPWQAGANARPAGLVLRIAGLAVRVAIGVVLCLGTLSAVLVVGWTARLAQRLAHARWRRSGADHRTDGRDRIPLPRWVFCEDRAAAFIRLRASRGIGGRLRAAAAIPFGSLAANFGAGLRSVACTFVLVAPAGLFMAFSWHAGWDNSFHKGYEQYLVGPLTGLAGVALLILAMLHVPIAQARQAVSGTARAFFDFRHVREVRRRRPIGVLLLALAYAVSGLVFVVSSVLLATAPASWPEFADLSLSDVRALLNGFYFVVACFLFPCFVVLKCWAARIYASAAEEAFREGAWTRNDLSAAEIAVLEHRIGEAGAVAKEDAVDESRRRPGWGMVSRAIGRITGSGFRSVAAALALVVWFAFAAELYVAQFFVARPVSRWINHPLVNLPWYRHVPPHLSGNSEKTDAAAEPSGGALPDPGSRGAGPPSVAD